MNEEAQDDTNLPLYGCLTGIELPDDLFEPVSGITLRTVFVDMFGGSMLSFGPPPKPSAPHPAPRRGAADGSGGSKEVVRRL